MDIVLIVAIIGFTGQIVAVIVAALLNSRMARHNAAAQVAIANAQRDAAKGAEELVRTAQEQNARLAGIASSTNATHKIVNSQRTVMLRMVAQLARRIADENPDDLKAQQAAQDAEQDAIDAQTRQGI